MPPLPPKLIDCPKCGDVNRVSGWDGRADWRCQNCGLVLLRAISPGQEPESGNVWKNLPRSEAPPSPPPAPRPKFKQWTDIHRLPSAEELESIDPHPKPPEWLTRSAIPQPSPKRDFFSGAGEPLPPRSGGAASSPENPSPSPESEEEEPPDWNLDEIGDFQPKEKPEPAAGGKYGRGRPAWFPRVIASSGVVLLLVLIGWLVRSVLTSRDRQTSAPNFESRSEEKEDWRKLALALAEKFANSSTPEEWVTMARDPERVAPLIRSFKPKFARGRPLGIKAFGSEPFGDDELYQFSVTYEDGRSRLIHVVPTPAGPKVDWEAFARSGGADFADLTAPAKVEAELRVLVRRARYYNYNFADDRRWRAYEVINGDWPEALTGYAAIGTIIDDALFRMVGPNMDGSPVRLILKVRAGGEDGARGQLEILEVVQQGWVKP